MDKCGACNLKRAADCRADCGGVWGGGAKRDCNGTCSGPHVLDACGVCGGLNRTLDCDGVCEGKVSTRILG